MSENTENKPLEQRAVSSCLINDTVEHALKIKKFHERINIEVGENVKPYMPQSIKIAHIYREIFLNGC
jgi:hypothetical protein